LPLRDLLIYNRLDLLLLFSLSVHMTLQGHDSLNFACIPLTGRTERRIVARFKRKVCARRKLLENRLQLKQPLLVPKATVCDVPS